MYADAMIKLIGSPLILFGAIRLIFSCFPIIASRDQFWSLFYNFSWRWLFEKSPRSGFIFSCLLFDHRKIKSIEATWVSYLLTHQIFISANLYKSRLCQYYSSIIWHHSDTNSYVFLHGFEYNLLKKWPSFITWSL